MSYETTPYDPDRDGLRESTVQAVTLGATPRKLEDALDHDGGLQMLSMNTGVPLYVLAQCALRWGML